MLQLNFRARYSANCLALFGSVTAVLACGGLIGNETVFKADSFTDEQFAAEAKLPLTTEQLQSTWRALAVPSIGSVATPNGVVRTSNGFLALSVRGPWYLKTAIYHSTDGVSWTHRNLGPEQDRQSLTDIACSPNRCVVAGQAPNSLISYASADGKSWQQGTPLPWNQNEEDNVDWNVQTLQFAGDYFFVASLFTGGIFRSRNGLTWQKVLGPLPSSTAQGIWNIAYGKGLYVAGGSGLQPQTFTYQSSDGETWEMGPEIDICQLSPRQGPCSFLSLDFVDGFFHGWGIQSKDAQQWTRGPAITMRGIAGTSLIGYGENGQLHAWDAERQSTEVSFLSYDQMIAKAGTLSTQWASSWTLDPSRYTYPSDQLPPAELHFPWPDGLNCRN